MRSEEGRREMSWGQREGSRKGMGIFTAFSKEGCSDIFPARSLPQCDLTQRRSLVLHPLESTGLWPLWPVDFSRQDTVTVPPTALACLEVSAFSAAWNVHYGWNQMPHKSPVTLGLPFHEEAQSSHVKRLCGQIVPAIPDMGIKISSYTHSLVEPSDDPTSAAITCNCMRDREWERPCSAQTTRITKHDNELF